MFFIFGFPILEVVVFFLAIGGDPKALKLAVVDEELGNFTSCTEYSLFNPTEPILHSNETCDYHGLSCNYLNRINQTKVRYHSEEAQNRLSDMECQNVNQSARKSQVNNCYL
jgi:hypothetical protein